MQWIQRLFGGARSAKADGNDRANGKKSRFRGVQVKPSDYSRCRAVSEIRGQRFLSDEVPQLPLDECDAEACECRYELFDDRRTDVRRTADEAFDLIGQYRNDEKRDRDSVGRRRTDPTTL